MSTLVIKYPVKNPSEKGKNLMSNIAIMRAKKLNSMGNVIASLQHCYRERDTPNANPNLTAHNEHHASKSTQEATSVLRELLPEKRRKDAVLVIEYVLTASPEWWVSASPDKQESFFDSTRQWVVDKYGAKNIVTATIHHDETSPHLSVFVVPITSDGRLSAKDYIGNRQKMTADQTTFAQAVAHLGLERGLEGSKATHKSIQQYYSAIERTQATQVTISPEAVTPKILKKGFLTRQEEAPEVIAERLTQAIREVYEPMAAKALKNAENERKAKELRKVVIDLQKRLKSSQEPFNGLLEEQMRDVLAMALKYQRQNELAKGIKKQHDVKRQR